MELDDLHSTIDVMERKEDTIVHSLNQQVTYLKQLDGSVRFNYQAIANLLTVLKGNEPKAQERFQDVDSKLAWSDKQSEAAAVIRQLEFALTQIQISIDEFVGAMLYVRLGRTPLNLVSSSSLREMLLLFCQKAMNKLPDYGPVICICAQ
jgi:hypothetical protein